MDRVTSNDGTAIAFEKVGSGPALILVDAAMCFRGFGPMGPLAAQLAPDLTVLTYDRRGRGDSGDTEPYAVDREVDDLRALIDAAGGSACLYGVSSGAVLALDAAAAGLAIPKLALFEPPLPTDGDAHEAQMGLRSELAGMVAAGRRGDAVERFQRAVGLSDEMIAQMRHAPFRPTLEAIAHTLVYDTTITSSLPLDRLATITTPALVIDSTGSSRGLRSSAQAASDALPDARYRSLNGQFHDVPAEVLAPVLREFLNG
jgi:alpha-beta hydrolase superfamily lysophospholipase